MKNIFYYLPCLILLACGSNNQVEQQQTTSSMNQKYTFLLGTYTDEDHQGVNLVTFDPEEESLRIEAVASEPDNPSYVISNKNQNLVFTVEETGGDQGGKVTSFQLVDGSFKKLNTVSAQGNGPCYISLDPTEKYLLVGNYSGGNFSVIPVDHEGNLSDAVQTVQHKGSSVNPKRQTQAHVHSVVFHPNEKRVLVADLGTDQVNVYDFDADENPPLQESPVYSLSVEPGAGPRHMVFNSNGDRLYLVHEMSAEIGVYSYDDGQMEHLETHSLLREDFEGNVGAAEVRISSDDAFLYVSNRGDANEIIVFEISSNEEELKHVQTISSQGKAPRNFALTPDEDYLIAGNQETNNLVVFKREKDSGKLQPTGISLEIHKPVYINFFE